MGAEEERGWARVHPARRGTLHRRTDMVRARQSGLELALRQQGLGRCFWYCITMAGGPAAFGRRTMGCGWWTRRRKNRTRWRQGAWALSLVTGWGSRGKKRAETAA